MVELKNETDVLVAKRHELSVRQTGDLGFGDSNDPGVRRVEAAEDVKQRALPNP